MNIFAKTLAFLAINVLCQAHAAEDNTPLVISLSSERHLTPVYISPFIQTSDAYPLAYQYQLEQILRFDLNHNGKTYSLKNEKIRDQIAIQSNLGGSSNWQDLKISYVIQPILEGNQLSAKILNVKTQNIKIIDAQVLTGDLNQDRRQIHRLADTIHKALFGIPGIATTKILYTLRPPSATHQWSSEIWEVDYDGGNAHPIIQDGYYHVTPTYLPPKPGFIAGGMLYVSYQLGQPKIFIASLKGGKGQRLSYLKGNQLMPAVSLQRDKVAFVSDVTGNPDLFVQSFSPDTGISGQPQQIFSAKQATQGTPTFSPDGNKIAFVSNKDGSPRIYILDIPEPGTSIKSLKPQLISKKNRENSAPAWSPDGNKIAYCAKNQSDREIWVYDIETGTERALTQGGGHKENPSWAPDSLHLVFNSVELDSSELYIINLNQTEAVPITFGKGEKRFPSWEPRLNTNR